MMSLDEALASFDAITQLPSPESYIDILQTCRKERNLLHAKRFHAHTCSHGVEKWLDNHLIPLFVDCGDIFRAHQLFHQAACRSDYTWNSIIQGFVEYGRPQQALDFYRKMQQDCAHPNKYTFVALLKACAKLNNGEMGKLLRAELAVNGFEDDSFVGSSLVYMYMKCGMIKEAQEFFNGFRARDAVSWNALITGYAEHGLGHEALDLIEKMKSEGVCPDAVTYLGSLKICSSLGFMNRGKEAHMEMVKAGLEREHFASNALVDMYSKLGSMDESCDLFKELQVQDVISWTSLITGCANHERSDQALLYLKQMQLQGFTPDGVTLASSLKACGKMLDIQSGEELHVEIVKKGLDEDPFIGNALMDMYIKCRSIAEAQAIFDNMLGRDTVSWNTLITGYIDEGLCEKVLNCLDQMQADGVCPDDITYLSYLKLCGSIKAVGRSQEIYSEIIMKGFEMDHFVGSSLVDVLAKCGALADARKVFSKLPRHDVALWNSLIAGYIEKGLVDDAVNCLEQMHQDGIDCDLITFIFSLKIFGSLGATDDGQCAHAEIVKRGLDSDSFIGNTLVDMYAKCALHAEAQKVFEKLPSKDVISWNAVIAGYAGHEHEEILLDCLEQMQYESLSPDVVTFVLILKGLSNLRALEKGREIHAHVIKKGFEEDVSVNSALIGIYADCGSLEESWSVFEGLVVKDVVLWTTLITGYAEFHAWEEVLRCFEQMTVEDMLPDAITLDYFLKACGNMGAVVMGQKLHADIVRRGLEEDPDVGSSVIDMYMDCGLFTEARFLFTNISTSVGESWLSFFAGNAEEGLDVEWIHQDALQLDSEMVLHSLEACKIQVDVDQGREVHMEVLKKGLDVDPVVRNSLMEMYARFGLFNEAQLVFDKLLLQDVVSWNVLIKAYAEDDAFEEAPDQVNKMLAEGMSPDAITYRLCLKACRDAGAEVQGRELHMEIVKKGQERDSAIGSTLVDMYAKIGLFLDSKAIFNKLPFPDIVSWTALIAGYVEHGHGEEALKCLEQMSLEGLSANAITHVCFLKLCGSLQDKDRSLQIHAEIIKMGFESESFLCNSLVDTYVKCSAFNEVQHAFDRLPVQDVVSFTALIVGYFEHGKYQEALDTFKAMPHKGVSPNHVTFSYSLNASGSNKDAYCGQEIHSEIVKFGYEKDLVVGDSLVFMYVKCGLFAEASEMLNNLPVRDVVSWNILITGYADHGLTEETMKCFQLMQHEGICADVVLWNTLILIYLEQGESENAIVCFLQMQQQGLLPDGLVFTSILKACGNVAAVDLGRRLHAQVCMAPELGASPERLTTALIDMYGKCGSVRDAQHVFNSRSSKIAVPWNALLASYGRQGDCESVFSLFDKMREEGIELNEVTFLNVLTACSHGGLVHKGQHLFESLSGEVSISSTVKHHTCMIDILGRAGQLEEAFTIVSNFPYLCDLFACNSVLGACQKWDDVQLGMQAFSLTDCLDEEDDAPLILMSNIFVGHS